LKVFVTGATGAIGRRLVPLLLDAGHDVAGMTRSHERAEWLRSLGARATVADAYDRDTLAAAIAAERPDAVMHQLTDLSGGSSEANARLRREGTRNLVDAVLAAGVPRLVAQSISWAYRGGDGPASEDEPLDLDAPEPRQVSVGGVHALESAVSEVPEGVVLRYGAFYGPGTWYAPGGAIAEKVRAGQVEATSAVTSFVHVDDAARAAVQALEWPAGVVNVVDDEPAPGTEWLPVYAGALGAPPPRHGPGGAATDRGASNARARAELAWEPAHPTWRTGFAQALG
jgi:nucleoside-diphosphate-sugar epimerase